MEGSTASFPALAELEKMLAEAPDLRAIKLELEKQKLQQSWQNHVTFHANYSQHFSSFVPFVPTPDLEASGGTFVGVSVSVNLARLLGRPTPEELDRRLKVLEYEKLFQQKLAALRLLFRSRAKLFVHLTALEAQRRTAGLQFKKVQIGLSLAGRFDPGATSASSTDAGEELAGEEDQKAESSWQEAEGGRQEAESANQDGSDGSNLPFAFDPIDLSEAEEKVARIESERRQAELEIENLETEILALLGKGRVQP